jgi:hypothetical protein
MLAKAATAAGARVLAQRVKSIADDGALVRFVSRHYDRERKALVNLADD